MTEVRAAVPEDRSGIMALCKSLHEENGQHPIDWPKVESMMDRCLAKSGGIIGVVGPIGEPAGAVALLLDAIWYSQDHQLLELFNYVHPDHRRSDYAKSLITYAKSCADMLGLHLTIGVLSNERMEAKVRLYGRMLPKAGEFFCYVPKSDLETMQIAAE